VYSESVHLGIVMKKCGEGVIGEMVAALSVADFPSLFRL
jgi:hypothetical protein